MKRLAGLSALALIIGNTSACSWLTGDDGYFRDRSNDYLESRQTQPMTLPEDVQTKRLDQLLPVPNTVASSTVKDYEVPRPPFMAPVGGVYSDFSLQKSADARWIVARRSQAEVWDLALQFFRDSGFEIAEEKQAVGEFITAWQPRKDLTAVVGRGQADEEDENADSDIRIRVRLEPGVQSNTTEVFVATAMRDADSGDEDLEWLTDTGVETSLLEGMLLSMGSDAEQSGPVSLLSERAYDAPKRIMLGEDATGNPVLSLGADYDRAWSSIGRALVTADIRVVDLNRTSGAYYIDLAQGADPSSESSGYFDWMLGGPDEEDEFSPERYVVRLNTVNNLTKIVVEELDGGMAAPDVALQVLNRIQTGLQ
jgi:outer membrane protein assembly factor BamC